MDVSLAIKERIKEYLRVNKIKHHTFCKLSGFSNGILENTSGISASNIIKFLTMYPHVNTDWLILGKGPMLRKLSKKQLIAQQKEHIAQLEKVIEDLTKQLKGKHP